VTDINSLHIRIMVNAITPPNASAQRESRAVAFAESKAGFEIPSADEILARAEDPALLSSLRRSLHSSVCKV
jgi:hypothetical protein